MPLPSATPFLLLLFARGAVSAGVCLTCEAGYALTGAGADCTGTCKKQGSKCAAESTGCEKKYPGAHCATCKKGDAKSDDSNCLTCEAGYEHKKAFSDCTGKCSAAKRGSWPCTAATCEQMDWVYVPNPKSIIAGGGELECAGGTFKVDGTYHLLYHVFTDSDEVLLKVAQADAPLGPWSKSSANPTIVSPTQKWEGKEVACLAPMDDGDEWVGYYIGNDPCSVGLATAPGPAGPWKKQKEVIKWSQCTDGGDGDCAGFYTGSIARSNETGGDYWLYTTTITDEDYGPMQLWTSSSREGPFKFKSSILPTKQWDKGLYSEARVEHHGGLWHTMYSGAHKGKQGGRGRRAQTLGGRKEQVGYAFSADGVKFTASAHNPLIPFDKNTLRFAEAHLFFEEPHVYVYHTVTYPDSSEELGVQVLTPASGNGSRPVSLPMPLLQLAALPAGGAAAAAAVPARLRTAAGRDVPARVGFRVACAERRAIAVTLRVYAADDADAGAPAAGSAAEVAAEAAVAACGTVIPAKEYASAWVVPELRLGDGDEGLTGVDLRAELFYTV